VFGEKLSSTKNSFVNIFPSTSTISLSFIFSLSFVIRIFDFETGSLTNIFAVSQYLYVTLSDKTTSLLSSKSGFEIVAFGEYETMLKYFFQPDIKVFKSKVEL
jgi:hypothetical protein